MDEARGDALRYTTFLTVAGLDPSGGAGILADVKTAQSLGLYAMACATALTVQNTCGVRDVFACDAEEIAAQLRALLEDIRPQGVKTGMVPGPEAARAIRLELERAGVSGAVVDPVLTSTSGHNLTDPQACRQTLAELLPVASIITPNLTEGETLSGQKIESEADLMRMARSIWSLCPQHRPAILLKGGHIESGELSRPGEVCNYLLLPEAEKPLIMRHPRVDTPNTHGTGCTLSSAIACMLGLHPEQGLEETVRRAEEYVYQSICLGAEFSIGHGHGPLCHLHLAGKPYYSLRK